MVMENNNTERQRGEVINFLPRKGYGFIRGNDGSNIFVHFSDIRGKLYRTLTIGEEVEYTVIQGAKGPQATDVVRLNPPPDEEIVILNNSLRTW